PRVGALPEWMPTDIQGLEVTQTARRIAELVFDLPVLPVPPVSRSALRLVTAGLLPVSLRDGFGLGLSRRELAVLHTVQTALRPPPRALHRYKGRLPGRPGWRVEQWIAARLSVAA